MHHVEGHGYVSFASPAKQTWHLARVLGRFGARGEEQHTTNAIEVLIAILELPAPGLLSNMQPQYVPDLRVRTSRQVTHELHRLASAKLCQRSIVTALRQCPRQGLQLLARIFERSTENSEPSPCCEKKCCLQSLPELRSGRTRLPSDRSKLYTLNPKGTGACI